MQNIEELVSNAVDYESANDDASLRGFLEEVALISDIDNYDADADAVVLMTIHSAKGLEFPVVYLPGMENGIFPSQQNQLDNEEMEEERRLAYVAITRAKQKLFCTYARERLLYGKTQYNTVSTFIEEMPSDKLDRNDAPKHRNYVFDSIGSGRSSTVAESSFKAQTYIAPKKPAASDVFSPGDDVIHTAFGKGTVLTVRPMGSDTLYEIAFDNFGTKKLMGSYARLKRAKTEN